MTVFLIGTRFFKQFISYIISQLQVKWRMFVSTISLDKIEAIDPGRTCWISLLHCFFQLTLFFVQKIKPTYSHFFYGLMLVLPKAPFEEYLSKADIFVATRALIFPYFFFLITLLHFCLIIQEEQYILFQNDFSQQSNLTNTSKIITSLIKLLIQQKLSKMNIQGSSKRLRQYPITHSQVPLRFPSSPFLHNNLKQQQNNNSIINELNLLEDNCNFDEGVVKVESFLYAASNSDKSIQQPNIDIQFTDGVGGIIPAIDFKLSRDQNPKNQYKSDRIHQISQKYDALSSKIRQSYGKAKRSIREEIMAQNQLLERRLSQKQYNLKPNFVNYPTTPKPKPEKNFQTFKSTLPSFPNQIKSTEIKKDPFETFSAHHIKFQQQFSKSKIIKLYNFIIQELPKCSFCGDCQNIVEIVEKKPHLVCHNHRKQEKPRIHPFIGILYDLENKLKFQQENRIFQDVFDKIDKKISQFEKYIAQLESTKNKLQSIKQLNRKKYKQINQFKFYLKKNVENMSQSTIKTLENMLPQEYIQQLDYWVEIKQSSAMKYQQLAAQMDKFMPLYIKNNSGFKFQQNLNKILNYKCQEIQEFKIYISQYSKFPIKSLEKATFIVDGCYSINIFDSIKNLTLQFINKKTQRQLNILFNCLPRHCQSISFNYNHKIHSHISAESFSFLTTISSIDHIKKINIKIQNLKDFEDLLKIPTQITNKVDFRLQVTKNVYTKKQLILPLKYYENLFNRLGKDLVIFDLKIPEASNSVAEVNYDQLINNHNSLCIFRLERGEKFNNKDNKILEVEQENYILKRIVFKKMIIARQQTINIIKKYSQKKKNHAIFQIIDFLI